MYTSNTDSMVVVLRKDRNALKATGPRTVEGKAASSRNSLKHGLTARQVVIPGENQANFDQLLAGIADDRNPEGELEIQLVGEIAACTWRLARARAREAEVLETRGDLFTSSDTGAGEGFDRLLRYMGSIERQLNRALSASSNSRPIAARPNPPSPNQTPKPWPLGRPVHQSPSSFRHWLPSSFRHPSLTTRNRLPSSFRH